MMKKKLLFLLFITLLLVGCKDKEITKVIDKSYIEKNNGIIFENYAVALDENNSYALFNQKTKNRYEKAFNINEDIKNSKLIVSNKYIYIFNNDGGFLGYRLDSTNQKLKKVEANFEEIDGLIYFPIKIYGISDGNIYLSYYKDDSKSKVLYASIEEDLSDYKSITKEDIPKEFDYVLIK